VLYLTVVVTTDFSEKTGICFLGHPVRTYHEALGHAEKAIACLRFGWLSPERRLRRCPSHEQFRQQRQQQR